MKCNQCYAARINGLFCHETGCPNAKKTWLQGRHKWVLILKCFECGCDVEEGTACDCTELAPDEGGR
jgi:hypothetical protein